MSPTRSRPRPRSLELALVIAAAIAAASCQSKNKERPPAAESGAALASAADAAPSAPSAPSAAIAACRAASDAFVKAPDTGPALLSACAPMFSEPRCRGALEAAGRNPTVETGMEAVVACKDAYCRKYTLAELCESQAPPTVRVARAQFPRLVADVLQGEHGANLGTLDAVAYLIIKPLLPTQRRVYIRAKAAGSAVTLAIGEDGWAKCKTDKTVRVARGADLRGQTGPLFAPLSAVGAGVEPALVSVLVDPDPDPRVREVATAAARFLVGRGMEVVTCFNGRANCPDVKSCP